MIPVFILPLVLIKIKQKSMKKQILTIIIAFFGTILPVFAQEVPIIKSLDPHLQPKKIVAAYTIEVGYGLQFPADLLAKRFGMSNYICGGVHYYTPKMWFFGLDGGYFFGNDLREDPLAHYKTADGRMLGKDREYSLLVQDERGFMIGAIAGKVFPLLKKYPESGIRASLTVGYLQHWIQQRDFNGQTPLLEDPYLIGFDRKTNGVHATEFIGFQFVDNKGYLNLFGGFEFTQGLTKSMRVWDTDLQQAASTATRLDILNGFRVGITLALRQPKSNEIFY
jgi:hypothetical protein